MISISKYFVQNVSSVIPAHFYSKIHCIRMTYSLFLQQLQADSVFAFGLV